MNISNIIKQHSVLIYFTLTIIISWGLVISVVGLDGLIGSTQEQDDLLYTVVFLLLGGPIISSILLIGLIYGKNGFKDFFSRLVEWNVNFKWYIIAFLLAPVIGFITLLLLFSISDIYLPAIITSEDKISLIITGLIIGLSAGVFEEIGWTGFAIPELRKKYNVFTTGLIVGIVWGLWHYITAIWGSGNDNGEFTLSLFLPMMAFYIIVLPAFRILMVWVYNKTNSLFIAILMHGSLTGNVIYILLSPELSADGTALTTWYFIFALALWLIIGILYKFDQLNSTIDSIKAVNGSIN